MGSAWDFAENKAQASPKVTIEVHDKNLEPFARYEAVDGMYIHNSGTLVITLSDSTVETYAPGVWGGTTSVKHE